MEFALKNFNNGPDRIHIIREQRFERVTKTDITIIVGYDVYVYDI